MKKRLGSVLVASTLGLGGLAAGVALAPAIASAADGTTAAAAPAPPTPPSAAERDADRTARLKDDLSGLVKDGTLTQQQADKVAETLASKAPVGGRGGPGRHGGAEMGRLGAAAKILGVTPEALRTELQGGKSLADVAAEKNIAKDTLVNGLVTEAENRLADRVRSGDITQAQADQRKADLRTRISSLVDREGLPARPDGARHGGPRDGAPQQPTG